MNLRLITGIVIVAIVVFVIFALKLEPHNSASTLLAASASSPTPAAAVPAPLQQQIQISNPASTSIRMKKHVMNIPQTDEEKAMLHERAVQLAKDPFSEWKTPIEFCGLVVDENNQPLPGAIAKWTTTNMEGNGHGEVTSGSDGRFSIVTVGKGMNVDVKKEGYRTVENNQGYEFSAFFQENYYDGDKDHPTIFHLKKIPAFEPIYIWNRHVPNANHLIGSRLILNPVTGQLAPGGTGAGLCIQLVAGPDNKPDQAQFSVILSTSGTGVLTANDPRDDQAPQTGYKNPSDQNLSLDYNRLRIVETTVFFKDNLGNYGKLYLDLELLGQELSISYRLRYNPNGGASLSAPQGSQFQINK